MLNEFIALDLETTGLDAKKDKIIEIGAVRFQNNVPVARFQTYVQPGRELENRITELTGITDEMLKGQPVFEEVAESLLDFLGSDVLLGHRVLFDYAFLKRAYAYLRVPFERQGIDTLKIARVCLPDLESRRLGDLCRHYQIPLVAHRASEDAMAAGILYGKMTAEFEKAAAEMPEALVYKVRKDCAATKAQKEQLARLLKECQTIPAYEIEKMTRSEASREIERLLQQIRLTHQK